MGSPGVADLVEPALCTLIPSVTEALHEGDAAAAALTVLYPAADTHRPLELLQPGRLSDAGLVDALVACERQLAALFARQAEFLAEIDRRDPAGPETCLREEVSCAMRVSPNSAAGRLQVAAALESRLWDTKMLLAAGRISYIHARILADATESLSDEVTGRVQARVLRRAEAQTPGEFRAAVRRAVARFDRKDENQRNAQAYADRKVVMYPTVDGMAEIVMLLGAEGAEIVMAAVNACAQRTGAGDTRTADERRADAAVEIALAALDNPDLPTSHGLRPTVNLTLAASTLVGADDLPGQLERYGPVPAEMARRIAAEPGATVRAWLVDPAGRLLGPAEEQQTTAYQPTAAITRHVLLRDQHCVHPGCRRAATTCQLDHRNPWPDGATSTQNLQALCKRHHDLKHRGRWSVTKNDDGSYAWTSGTGHTYSYRPPELPAPEQPPPSEPNVDPPPF